MLRNSDSEQELHMMLAGVVVVPSLSLKLSTLLLLSARRGRGISR